MHRNQSILTLVKIFKSLFVTNKFDGSEDFMIYDAVFNLTHFRPMVF